MPRPGAAATLLALSPILYGAFLVTGMALTPAELSSLGEQGDADPALIAAAVQAGAARVGLQGLAFGLAGLSLLGFVHALHAALPRGLPTVGRLAGAAWGVSTVAGGALTHAAVEAAGHFAHPDGVKAALLFSFQLVVSPAIVACGAVLACAVGVGILESGGLPRWFARASLGLAVFLLVGAVLFAAGVSGAAPLVVLPLWLVAAGALLVRRAWRSPDVAGAGAGG